MAPSHHILIRWSLLIALAYGVAACGGGGGGGGSNSQASDNLPSSGQEVSTTPGSSSIGSMGNTASSNTQTGGTQTGNTGNTNTGVQTITSESVVVTPSSDGKSITTSPTLYKTNGATVQKLEDLPEGLSNSTWMKKTGTRSDLHVSLQDGTYFLSRPWTWTPAQSGRSDSKLFIEAKNPGAVTISGARTFSVAKAVHAGAAKTTVDLSAAGLSAFDQMWVNGSRAVLARSPNVGSFYYIKNQVTTWSGASSYGGAAVANQAFAIDATAANVIRGATSTQLQAATLVAMHSWTTSYHRVQELNANNEARVLPVSKWPFMNADFGQSQRYFIENLPSALDAPAEWYLNPNNKLDYMLTTADKTVDLEFEIPQLSTLLVLQGDVSHGKWVEYVAFSGLKFKYALANIPSAGYVDNQASSWIGAAIQVDGARNIALTGCEVSKVGGYAIWLRTNVMNSSVDSCEIFDTGAGGVRVGLLAQPVDANATSHNSVINNRIHATGHRYPGSVGVWIGDSAYNKVEDNLIGDTTYTGISVGWTWGLGTSAAHHNSVRRNFLYDIAQMSLGDAGAIYTVGVSPDTVIAGNVIKNVRAFSDYGAGAWGLYNDEGSSNITMDSNIVVGTSSGGYLLNYGASNTLSNNVLAKGDVREIQYGRSSTSRQVTIDSNFFFPFTSDFVDKLLYNTTTLNFQLNQVSNAGGSITSVPAECGSGCNLTSSISLSDPGKFDVPVLRNASGVVTLPNALSRSWTGVSLTATPSPALLWSSPPNTIAPRGFDFDASTANVGDTPAGISVLPANHPEYVSVIRNAGGEQCLAFKDSALMVNRYEPAASIGTSYFSGTSTAVFTLKADATTEFIHEWRDSRTSVYLAGPSILFSASKGIRIGNRQIATLPIGQWMTVTVTAQQGSSAKWSVTINFANGTSVSAIDQAPTSTGWSATRAVFFISDAATTSTPCLGRISLSNR